MAQRKGRCQVLVHLAGRKPIKCGMQLDKDGKCVDHGKQK